MSSMLKSSRYLRRTPALADLQNLFALPEFVLTKVIFIKTVSKGTNKVCTSVRLIQCFPVFPLNRVLINQVLLYVKVILSPNITFLIKSILLGEAQTVS